MGKGIQLSIDFPDGNRKEKYHIKFQNRHLLQDLQWSAKSRPSN